MRKQLSALVLQCNRCGHKWLRRMIEEPKECPGCKTRYWNKPRVRNADRNRNSGKAASDRSHAALLEDRKAGSGLDQDRAQNVLRRKRRGTVDSAAKNRSGKEKKS